MDGRLNSEWITSELQVYLLAVAAYIALISEEK